MKTGAYIVTLIDDERKWGLLVWGFVMMLKINNMVLQGDKGFVHEYGEVTVKNESTGGEVMKLLVVILAVFSFQAFSMNMDSPRGNDFPKKDQWALAMISMACDVSAKSMVGMTGEKEMVSNGVIWKAIYSGDVVMAAWASNASVFSQKKCLTE